MDAAEFRNLYAFAHEFGRASKSQRNVGKDVASAMLQLLFTGRSDAAHVPTFVAFLASDACKARVVTHDEWLCFAEFNQLAAADASNYTEDGIDDGSWPGLIDAYVEWLRARGDR
ncbi:defective in Cullin neddylation protein DCN1, partial [Thecamonas trahens ATCC 50062]